MKKKIPPGPSYFSIRSKMLKDTPGYLFELMKDYGEIVKIPWIKPVYLINDAEMIKYILKDNQENYIREGMFSRPIRSFLGDGLLQLNGEEWRLRRKSLAPIFQPKRIAEFVPIIQSIAKIQFRLWDKNHLDGLSFDICPETMKIAYRIALSALFNQSIEEEALEQLSSALLYLHKSSTQLSSIFFKIFRSQSSQYNQAKTIFKEHIDGLIQFNKVHPTDNFIQTLLNTKDVNNKPLSEQAIFDEIRTFLMTGHETSATAIAWAIYLLAKYPEIQKKVKDELQAGLSRRDPDFADLMNLPYTHAVFNETIRLFPPIWGTNRVCRTDDKIGDYLIRKNSVIIICPYTLHRREIYWQDPLAFNPERHLVDKEKKPHQFAFIPFGGGPRICIASHFGTMESVIIIAMILQRYTIRLDDAHPIEFDRLISLKPRYGIKVFLDKDKV